LRGIGVSGSEQLQHIFCCLLEVGFAVEERERSFFGKKVNLEDIDFGASIGKIASPAPVMLKRWADVPTGAAVVTERGSCGRIDMSDNPGA
jgi:hypothetical protein